MKIGFLVKGLGEYSQAYAVANSFREHGEESIFLYENPFLGKILQKDSFPSLSFSTPEELKKIIQQNLFDALFLCNSHTTGSYHLEKPAPRTHTFSLDSNWLFHKKRYRALGAEKFSTYNWIDRIYCLFPEPFFKANLKENGGYYEIDEFFIKKIVTPGFIPTSHRMARNQKLTVKDSIGLKKNDVLITSYFSRLEFHSSTLKESIPQLQRSVFEAVEVLRKNDPHVKLLDLTSQRATFGYHFSSSPLSTTKFDHLLLASDLVIMHYGYGTLPKLFSQRIPTICCIPRPSNTIHSNFFELKPCIDQKAIDYLFFDQITIPLLTQKIQTFLFDTEKRTAIQEAQKHIFAPGEKSLLDDFYKKCNVKI